MKYIASFSGSKDSVASIILAHEHNEPLDEIIFAEVMFDEETSGELPEHIDFIKNKAFPLFESWGYKTTILHHNRTYMDYFNQVRQKGKNIGKKVGFPMADKCNARACKTKPIEKYIKSLKGDYFEYVGIGLEEKQRLHRLHNHKNKISLLEKEEFTTENAKQLAIEYGLLSPYYDFSKRGGCWFCPNATDCQLRNLRDNHSDLWDRLLQLEQEPNLIGKIWNTRGNVSLYEKSEQFRLEDAQMTIFDFLESEE